jgi:hypothetical protein
MNKNAQYYMFVLLIVIARRLLYPYATSEQDRQDLFDFQHAIDFVKKEFEGEKLCPTPRAADAGLGCPSCFETGDFPVGSNNKICTRCKGTGHV